MSNQQTSSRSPTHRFVLQPFDKIELATGNSYLVRGLVPREGLVVIWGPPKCGKSFWAFDLLMHIAMGWEYRGRRITQGTVVYVACEGERGLSARVEAFRRERLGDATDGAVPFYLVTTKLDLAAEHETLISDIRAQIGDSDAVAIVIDTLNRSLAGSESSDEDMGAYVRAADAIREAFRCAVLIIHHCGINDTRPRGHTSLAGAADAQIAVKRDVAGIIVATVELMKDGESGSEMRSALRQVELGRDDEGETITSCIVDAMDAIFPAANGKRQKALSAKAKAALDLLNKALSDAGEPAPFNNHIPSNARVVAAKTWRSYCYAGSIAESDKPDAQRKAFGRVATELQSAGFIGIWTDWVWLIDGPSSRR